MNWEDTTPDEPTKIEALQGIMRLLNFGGPELGRRKRRKQISFNFLDFMMKIFPDRNQSLYTPTRRQTDCILTIKQISQCICCEFDTRNGWWNSGSTIERICKIKCDSTVEYCKFISCIINDSKYFFNIVCQLLLRIVCQ